MAMEHWRASVHTEGVPPRAEQQWCWLDPERAADWLDTKMMRVENKAENESRWDDKAAAVEARLLAEERFTGTGTGLVDENPAEWLGQGPAVDLLGVNYVIEGCACEAGAAIEIAEALRLQAEDAAFGCGSLKAAAEAARVRYDAAEAAWRGTTPGGTGGVVPVWVIVLKRAAEIAEQRYAELDSQTGELHRRSLALVEAAALGRVTVCGAQPYHKRGGCGMPARVYRQNAYNDSEDCTWCGKSTITRNLGD